MSDAPWSARLPRMSPARAFAAVFLAIFLLIFLGSVAVTFTLPESYTAVARVIASQAAQLQLLQSAELLTAVSHQLKLPETLAARYGEDKPWDDKRVEDVLRRSIQVRPVSGTDVINIRADSRSPEEAAQLANEIAAQAQHGSASIRLIDKAIPPLRPSRPNKPLNLALGAVVGLVLGIMAGGVGAKLAVGFDGHRSACS